MNTPAQEPSTQSFQELLDNVLGIAKRSLAYWPVLVVAACLGVVAFVYTPRFLPPVYASTTVLSYREVIQQEALLGNNLMPAETRRSRNTRLKERLFSRSTLQPIMQAQGLYSAASSDGEMANILDDFRGQIQCDVSEGDTFTITYRGASRQKAYAVTLALGNALMNLAKDYGVEQAEATRTFLRAQLDAAAADLNKAEQSLAAFLAKHPEFAMPEGTQTTSRFGASSAGRAGRPTVGGYVARARPSMAGTASGTTAPGTQTGSGAASGPTISPEAAASLRAAEADVARARENLIAKRAQYTDIHPDVTAAQNGMDAALGRLRSARLRAQEEEEASAAAPAPEAASPVAEGATPGGPAEVASAKANPAVPLRGAGLLPQAGKQEAPPSDERIVELETEWTTLSREAALARERNEQLERQLFRVSMVAEVQTSGGGSRIVVMDPAFEPRGPLKRGPRRVGAVAFTVVFVLGMAVAVAMAATDGRVWTSRDVVRCGLGPLVHTVPPLASQADV